jgi:hypothetical protein
MKNFSGKLISGDAPTEQAEIEGLKRYGWSEEQIASMTPAERRRESRSSADSITITSGFRFLGGFNGIGAVSLLAMR